jgi:hypothetical protein
MPTFRERASPGGQHNPVTLDFGIERITRAKAKLAPDWTRKNDLTFRGNLGFRHKPDDIHDPYAPRRTMRKENRT